MYFRQLFDNVNESLLLSTSPRALVVRAAGLRCVCAVARDAYYRDQKHTVNTISKPFLQAHYVFIQPLDLVNKPEVHELSGACPPEADTAYSPAAHGPRLPLAHYRYAPRLV